MEREEIEKYMVIAKMGGKDLWLVVGEPYKFQIHKSLKFSSTHDSVIMTEREGRPSIVHIKKIYKCHVGHKPT